MTMAQLVGRSLTRATTWSEADAPQQVREARILAEDIEVKVDAQPYQQP